MSSPWWRALLCSTAMAVAASVLVLVGPPTPEAGAQSTTTVQFDRDGYNAAEGDSAHAKLTFSPATTSQATFTINTTAGTATAGDDFTVGPHSCTVPSGRTSHVCNIPVLADSQIEDYEQFTIALAPPPSGFTLGANSTATVQIVNVSVVPDNWALKPSGVGPGEQFRLLFKTHNERDGTASAIATYDTFVRNRVSGASTGHADIRQYSSTFRVVGSTPTVGAAWHTATGIMVSGEPSHTPFSTPIYWLNGPKIADDYNDFWDGTWDDNSHGAQRRANGNASTNNRGPNTGTQTGTTHATAGTKRGNNALGTSGTHARWGGGDPGQNPISQGNIPKGNNNVYAGLSGIFEVDSGDAANPTISIAATQEKVTEGDTIRFTIRSMPPPTTQKSVSVTVDETTDGGRNFVPASQRGDRTVTVPVNTGTVTFTVRTTDNDRSERDGGVTVTVNDGTSYDPHDTLNTASTVIESDEEFNELSAGVALGNGSTGPAHTGARVVFKFDTGEAQARELSGIRTQLAWSGDVISPRSDHRPTKWDQFWYHPDTGRPGGYVRTGLERTIYRNNTGFDTDIYVKNRQEAGGDVDNGWIAMRSIASGKTAPHPDAEWACMAVGSGTCPSAWPGVPAATVVALDNGRVISGEDARFRVSVNPAPGTGETKRVYLRTWYRYLRGGGQDQNEAFRHVDVGSSGTATFAMPTRISRTGPGRTVNVQVQEDIAYNRGGTTHAWVDTTRFNPSSQPCWYGHTHYPASSPYAVRIGPIDVETLKQLARHGVFGARNENEADFNSDGTVDALDLDRSVLPRHYHHYLDVTRHAAMGITDCLTADEIDDLGQRTYRTVWTTCKVDYGHTDHTHGSYTDGRGGSHSHHHNYFPADKFGDGNCAFAGFRSDSQSDSQTDAGFPDPGVLTFSEVTATAMTLSWPERDVDHYLVYWGESGDGANVQEVEVDADTHSYTISGLKPGTVYAVIVYSHDLNEVTTTGYQPTATESPYAGLIADVTEWRNDTRYVSNQDHTDRWDRVLLTLGETVADTSLTKMTAAEAQTYADRGWTRWDSVVTALAEIEAGTTSDPAPPDPVTPDPEPVTPDPDPEISVAGGGGVTEGGDAIFAVTAVPAPSAPLAVNVSVSQSGDFGVSPGTRTVTIPASGSATLTVDTTDDSTDEADGQVTVAVAVGSGYTVSPTAGTATVAVADDDDPPPVIPQISVAGGGGVTEGGDATFTVSAVPAPSAALSVDVSVSQSGDFGVATGSRTVTVGTSGTATLTVATTNDSADEADGQVTVAVAVGSGYTVSQSAGSATVAVSDDDDPPPPPVVNATPSLSISDASAGEGGTLTFTVTLSPASDRYVWVNYYARPAYGAGLSATYADFAQAYGMLTFKPGETSKTITVAAVDDNSPEDDETFTVVLYSAVQAAIADGEGIGTITDND